jgi:hypothetical protein
MGDMVARREGYMSNVDSQIREIVDREAKAWDTRDVELLLSAFHQDMV